MLPNKKNQLVQTYFEGTGYERFQRTYGTGHCSRFQAYVREGHAATIDTTLSWLDADGDLGHLSVCDAGCGVGALSIPLARSGAQVHAFDFSRKMIEAARRRAEEMLGSTGNPRFEVEDLTAVRGKYHTVVCIDVFARYSVQRVIELLTHLSRLATTRLILSFTPNAMLDGVLLKIGNSVARRQHAPLLHTHRGEVITKFLATLGWDIGRRRMIAAPFKVYYCCLLEFIRCPDGGATREPPREVLADLLDDSRSCSAPGPAQRRPQRRRDVGIRRDRAE